MSDRARSWQLERWISTVRLLAVPWAILEITVFTEAYPSTGYEAAAWATTLVLAVGAIAFFAADRRSAPERFGLAISVAGLAFDALIVWAYALVFTFEPSTPIQQLLLFPVVEAALRFGLVGALAMAVAQAGVLIA